MSLTENEILIIEKAIGYTYKDKSIIQKVFTHKSVFNCNNIYNNYEKFEFLGDSILGFIIADYLFTHYPLYNEGVMTVLRSKIVSREPLSNIIFNLGNEAFDDKDNVGEGIARYLKFGNGDYTTQLTEKVRCDLFEALVGSIYVDSGKNIEKAKEFIMKHLDSILNAEVDASIGDSKSKLQEYCQKRNIDGEYVLIDEEGPDHNKSFSYSVYLDGELMGDGVGANKKVAQQHAAKEALKKLGIEQ